MEFDKAEGIKNREVVLEAEQVKYRLAERKDRMAFINRYCTWNLCVFELLIVACVLVYYSWDSMVDFNDVSVKDVWYAKICEVTVPRIRRGYLHSWSLW